MKILSDEVLKTLKFNFERGCLVDMSDRAQLGLEDIVTNWSKQVSELEQKHVKPEAYSSAIAALPIGTPVNVVGFDTEVVIVAVMIEGKGHLQYQVASWQSGERKTSWCSASEVEPCAKALPMRIGFGVAVNE